MDINFKITTRYTHDITTHITARITERILQVLFPGFFLETISDSCLRFLFGIKYSENFFKFLINIFKHDPMNSSDDFVAIFSSPLKDQPSIDFN